MQITENLGLLKPDQDDFYNVDDFNNNMDKIDSEIEKKVDKITGKSLSSNDYTDEEKAKLQGVEENANNYIHPDTHTATMITQDSAHRFIADSERTAWNNMLQSAKDYSDGTYQQATGYTDTKIAALINGAPSTLDTLGELAEAMAENESVVEALDNAIGQKANDVEFQAHKSNATVHVTSADKAKWNNMLSSSGGTVDGDTEFKNNKIDILTLTRKDTANGAAIKYQNNAKVLGYLGFEGSGNPVIWEGSLVSTSTMYRILLANKQNTGTLSMTTSVTGGTALILDNTNSADDRTYVAFKNKGQAAGYLSMSGNDLYTYKNKTNCKILDSENYNSVITDYMKVIEVENNIKLKVPVIKTVDTSTYYEASINNIVKVETVNAVAFLKRQISLDNSHFVYRNGNTANISTVINNIYGENYIYINITNNSASNMFVEFSNISGISVESIS